MNGETQVLTGFATGTEVEAPCDRIAETLDRLWRGYAKKVAAGRGEPVHRACLLNLVVHAGDTPAEIVAGFLAMSLTDRIPARVFVLRARPDEPGDGSPRARVSAVRTHDAAGGRRGSATEASAHASRVAGEMVLVEASGRQLARVPAVVRAALEPDVTTVLWWTGRVPPPLPYVGELRDLADRILLDSEAIPDHADVSHLVPARDGVGLADLAWPRQKPWRTALARVFDPPELRALLPRIREVDVAIAARGGDATAAPLLTGWLAEALRWGPCSREDARTVRFGAPGGGEPVTVRTSVLPRADGPARGGPLSGAFSGVASITLRTSDGRTVTVRRTADGTVCADVPEGSLPVRPARFRELDPAEVLADALLASREDPIAPAAIRRAALFPQLATSCS